MIFGGEALSPWMLKEWYNAYPATSLINMYGITETTVHVTFKSIGAQEIAEGLSNIGRPLPSLYVYIMDESGNVLPAGLSGEIVVGGAGVSRGYLNREELTRQRFTEDPYRKGARLYRSGDLGMLLENGDIWYQGRKDSQVKIRGNRIELGEIEQVLVREAGASKALVTVMTDEAGDQYLAGYYTSAEASPVSGLRDTLMTHLPEYMVPSRFVYRKVSHDLSWQDRQEVFTGSR